jgi:hypothetical protein
MSKEVVPEVGFHLSFSYSVFVLGLIEFERFALIRKEI